MKLNVGTADRFVRVVLGLAICAAGLHFKSSFGLLGLFPLGTALAGWCPLYVVLGISTRGLQSEESSTGRYSATP